MIESRNDLILRILDEIAFLTARLVGLQAMGMSQEILKEVERLDQASRRLNAEDQARVEPSLRELRRQAGM